jgi:hypothetical protein
VALQDPLAVAVAGYRTPPPSFTRGGPGSAIMRKVLLINPDYNANMWQAQRDTVNEFSNTSVGKAGGQALALNTLVHHADLWLQAAEALKNGNFRPGNAAYNAVASTFGSAPPTEANLVARFLAGETGKVASGGVPAEGEINGILKNLGNDAGPDQIAAAGKSLLQVAGGRMVPLKERAKAMHVDGIVQVLGPDAEAILRRRGFDPETMKPAAPGAATGAAGIPTLPAKLSKADEGKVFLSPKTGKKLKITAVNPQDGSQFKSVEVK